MTGTVEGETLGNAEKCVVILEEGLGVGLAVNAAAVLAITLGRKAESIVGPDVTDGSGGSHGGLVDVPIPVLKADAETVEGVRSRAVATDGLLVVGFTNVAQTSRTYGEYTERMAATSPEELRYLGVALYGDRKLVNKLTGSLPLLR